MSTQESENKLNLAETTYRWLNEYAPQGVFTTNKGLKITSWNHWLVMNSGLNASQVLGQNLFSLFPSLRTRKLDRYYQAALNGQVSFLSQRLHKYLLPMPPKFKHSTYEQMQQSVHVAPLFDGDEVIGTVTVIEDVTERLMQENAIKESEARYHSLFDGVPIGLYRTTPDGRILDVNEAMVHMLRYPSKEALLQESVINLYVSANTRDDWKIQLALKDEIYRLEVRLRRYDGTEIWAEDVARAVRDEQGGILFYDGSLQDITDRKEAEEALKRREYELKTTIAHLPEGVLLLDGEHHIVMANPAAQKVLNLLVDEGQPKLEVLGDTPLTALENKEGQPWQEIRPAGDKSGEMVFEATAVSLPGNAEIPHIGCIIVLRDVTEERQRQQYQAAQERLATVGQMAAGIAHDFNNIMATVVLYAQLIRRTETLSPRYQRYISTIEEQANRAAELTRQMLDFSRRSVLSRQEMDILPFLKEIFKLLERTLPENINLYLQHDQETLIVNVDPTRFQQILMNLALNARDAMPQGGDLTIKVSQLSVQQETAAPIPNMPPGNWLVLTVQDTGEGIPEEHLPRIFEPFFTTKGPDRGTGLGLSQVYGIIKQHEGYIDVFSKMGVGTTFIIYLPIGEFQETVVLPAPINKTKILEGNGELILVIEDNLPARLALCEVLEEAGYKTLAAENGHDALARFDESTQKISLVLSDLVMPVLSGEALFDALKQRDPQIKIIVITGYPLDNKNRQLLESKVVDWLQKPFTADQILEAVFHVLNKQ
ncbi:MAG: hypothetical protein Kow0080_02640 [Candidatus Promineifilaceae bacterium]